MLIVVKLAEASSKPYQTFKMNLLAKTISDYKGEFKTLWKIWVGAFPQVVTGYRDEFRILLNIYNGAFVFA